MKTWTVRQFDTAVKFVPVGGHIGKVLRKAQFYESCPFCILASWYERYPKGTLRTVIDGGASIGNHTMYLSCVAEAERVVAIEPGSRPCRYLRRNAKLNKVEVELHEAAAGAEAGIFQWERITAPMITLDSLDLRNVDLVKVDVEENFMAVLRGSRELLTRESADWWIEVDKAQSVDFVDGWMDVFGYEREDKVYNWTPTYLYTKRKG